MRTVDERRERRQVDLDHLVEVRRGIHGHVVVGAQVVCDRVGRFGDRGTPGGLEVAAHRRVVGEHGSGGADLGTHVADGGFTGATDGVRTRSEVFDDGARAAFDGEDLGHLQNDVFGC